MNAASEQYLKPEVPRESGFLKHAIIAFLLALVGYAIFYSLDQHLRLRRGPWIVEFRKTEQSEPLLVIQQPALGISNVQIAITGKVVTNEAGVTRFDKPLVQPQFGKMIYHDLTYLPGAVVIELLGHEIQLIPRTLVIDKKERGWKNGERHELRAR